MAHAACVFCTGAAGGAAGKLGHAAVRVQLQALEVARTA